MLITTNDPQVSLKDSNNITIKTNLRPDEKIFLVPNWKIIYETTNLKNIIKITEGDNLEYSCFDKNDNLIIKKIYKIDVPDIEMQVIDIISNITAICDYDDDIQPTIFKRLAEESLENGGTEIFLIDNNDVKTKSTLDDKIVQEIKEVHIKTSEFLIISKLVDNKIESEFRYLDNLRKKLVISIKIEYQKLESAEYLSIYDLTRIILNIISQKEKELFNQCYSD